MGYNKKKVKEPKVPFKMWTAPSSFIFFALKQKRIDKKKHGMVL